MNSTKKIVIVKYNNGHIVLLIHDGKTIEISAFKNNNINIGDIYTGIVTETKENINACFVDISNGYKGFIKDIHKNGSLIPVMIKKKGSGDKKDTVTSELAIPGVFSVVFKDKIIRRTNSSFCSDRDIELESDYLLGKLNHIEDICLTRTKGSCLYKAPNPVISYTYSQRFDEFDEIITDDIELYNEFLDYISEYKKIGINLDKTLRLYSDANLSLSSLYSIKTRLDDALLKKVWLNSGAFIVIEKTEAMTVVDVNSSGTSYKGNKEDVFHKVNLEALTEINRQIRLRNLSGIITVDFLKTNSSSYKEELLKESEKIIKNDRKKLKCHGFTPLGLVEFSRKRVEPTLYEQIRELNNE